MFVKSPGRFSRDMVVHLPYRAEIGASGEGVVPFFRPYPLSRQRNTHFVRQLMPNANGLIRSHGHEPGAFGTECDGMNDSAVG